MGIIGRFLFTSLLLTSSFLYSQEDPILWTESLVLSWSDFKDTPKNSMAAAALTASGISYQFSAEELNGGITIDCEISAFFYPEKSWYKPEICDENILKHEQLHFDIAELYARKMRLKIKQTRFTKNVKKEIKDIYQGIIRDLSNFQDIYDNETDFSRNIPNQLRWNQKIEKALEDSVLKSDN